MTAAARIVGRGPLLLDFDGPVCSIFAGYPAPNVAQELVTVLRSAGVALPANIASQGDPLEVLRWTGKSCPNDLTVAVEATLCAAEVRAVETAAPTSFGHDVVLLAHRAGIPVAVVSNNSAEAVTAYLRKYRLLDYISPIVGRTYAQPALMKPNPVPILTAVAALQAESKDCVLIGDSLSDIEGGRAAGVCVIGYANRSWKIEGFSTADAVITSMGEILAAISTRLER